MTQYTYCPKCDKDVEAIEVSMGTRGGGTSLRCSECGHVLATIPDKVTGEAGEQKVKLEFDSWKNL